MTAAQSTLINLILYIALVAIGIVLGGKQLWNERVAYWLGKLQFAALMALILALGIKLGADDQVIASLGQIGLSALLITLFSMTGSLSYIWIALADTKKLGPRSPAIRAWWKRAAMA